MAFRRTQRLISKLNGLVLIFGISIYHHTRINYNKIFNTQNYQIIKNYINPNYLTNKKEEFIKNFTTQNQLKGEYKDLYKEFELYERERELHYNTNIYNSFKIFNYFINKSK